MTEDMYSAHFARREFRCKCGKCRLDWVDPELIRVLEEIRSLIGDKPMKVYSGRRCPEHNQEVGGAKRSQHLIGNAADIAVDGVDPFSVAQVADTVLGSDRGGVGIYDTFTHVDIRAGRPWRADLRRREC